MAQTYVYPNGLTTPPYVTDSFGMRIHPITGNRTMHYGTDSIGHPAGYNYSPAGGKITFAAYNGGAGNQITVTDYDGVQWNIKHNANLDGVWVGLYVNKGQRLAPTGTTGNSTGIHCHTECFVNGGYTDPWPFIAARITPGGGGNPPSGGSDLSAEEVKVIIDTLAMVTRREGAARGRLIYDGGEPNAEQKLSIPWDRAIRAVLIGNGWFIELDKNPANRIAQLEQVKGPTRSLILPWQENPAGLSSTEYNLNVEALLGDDSPYGTWVANWIEVDQGSPQTTWQEMSDGKKYGYSSRWQVWADLRPVEIRKNGKKIVKFERSRSTGKSYGVFEDERKFEMTAGEIGRADAQKPTGQVYVPIT